MKTRIVVRDNSIEMLKKGFLGKEKSICHVNFMVESQVFKIIDMGTSENHRCEGLALTLTELALQKAMRLYNIRQIWGLCVHIGAVKIIDKLAKKYELGDISMRGVLFFEE